MAASTFPAIVRLLFQTAGPSRTPAFSAVILGASCFRGGKWCICTNKRRLGRVPSLAELAAERQHCWDRREHRTVWNVECKQSVLPATAQLHAITQTYRAVSWEQQNPRSCLLELQPRGHLSLVMLDQIITVNKLCPFSPPHPPSPGIFSY